jgi:muramoyltetrapeptide carboxypeptidase LdcA involved in peptidoglycan recycling
MRLSPGDEVALVAPAARLKGGDIGLQDKGVALLESWGLRVRVLLPSHGHLYLAVPTRNRRARSSRQRTLFLEQSPVVEPVAYVHDGHGQGPLIGGCLTMIAGLLGSPYLPSAMDRVVSLDGINSLGAVIEDVLGSLDIPLAIGLRSGHGDVNISIRIGAPTTLDAQSGVVEVG